MASIQTADDIKKLGTILGVWAHPDDETFTSAGIMAAAINNGQKVICVTATRGESGVQDESKWPADKLAKIREAELRAALDVIGVKQLNFLDYKDGSCDLEDEEPVRRILEIIEHDRPDTILTFGSDGLTGHPDHQAVCGWAIAASAKSNRQPQVYHAVLASDQMKNGMTIIDKELNFFYNLGQPRALDVGDCSVYFKLSPELAEKKYQALQAMPSQYNKLLELFPKETVCSAFSIEAFVLN